MASDYSSDQNDTQTGINGDEAPQSPLNDAPNDEPKTLSDFLPQQPVVEQKTTSQENEEQMRLNEQAAAIMRGEEGFDEEDGSEQDGEEQIHQLQVDGIHQNGMQDQYMEQNGIHQVKQEGPGIQQNGMPQITPQELEHLKENYKRFCEHRYKEIIVKRPDLLSHNDLVTRLIVQEWEQLPHETKMTLQLENLMPVEPHHLPQPSQIPPINRLNLAPPPPQRTMMQFEQQRKALLQLAGNGQQIQKPKKKMHPYLYFVQDRRAQIGRDNPGASFRDLMGIVSQQWNAMSAEEKQKYNQMADIDRVRFDEEVRIFQESLRNGAVPVKKEKRRRGRGPSQGGMAVPMAIKKGMAQVRGLIPQINIPQNISATAGQPIAQLCSLVQQQVQMLNMLLAQQQRQSITPNIMQQQMQPTMNSQQQQMLAQLLQQQQQAQLAQQLQSRLKNQ